MIYGNERELAKSIHFKKYCNAPLYLEPEKRPPSRIIDIKSTLDVTSRLGRNQARKLLSEILHIGSNNKISFSKHCREELTKDNLTTVDVLNTLKAGLIKTDPEYEKGTYRYRVETEKIMVVISFMQPDFIRCVTAWRK